MPRRSAEAAMEQRRKDKRRPANCNRRVRPNADVTDLRPPQPPSLALACRCRDAYRRRARVGTGADMTENDSDEILARVLGPNMQQATLRMVLYLAIAAAVVATIVVLA
jgi:hypothetical protein